MQTTTRTDRGLPEDQYNPLLLKAGADSGHTTYSVIKVPRIIVLWQFCKLRFSTINEQNYKNTCDVIFPGRLFLCVKDKFSNPIGKVFGAVEGLVIQAGLVKNRGVVKTLQGPLELDAHRIDNEKALVQSAQELILQADEIANMKGVFSGKSASLLHVISLNPGGNICVATAAEIAIYGRFDNSHEGVIKVYGTLTLQEGFWEIGDGLVFGQEGIKGYIKGLYNPKEGEIISSKGPVDIMTMYDLLHEGIIRAGNGINLTSENSPVIFKNSELLTPNKTIIIKSKGKFQEHSRLEFPTKIPNGRRNWLS